MPIQPETERDREKDNTCLSTPMSVPFCDEASYFTGTLILSSRLMVFYQIRFCRAH
jgi:hypothetical protein